VALDSFRTATTDIADYILPTPTFHERQEIVGLVNYNLGILQQSRPLVEPPAEVRSSSSIYKELLARLGHDVKDCEPSIESVGDQLRQYYLRNLNDIKQAVTLANNHVEQLQSQGYTKYQTFSHTVSKLNLEKLQYMVGLKPMARTEKYPYILSCGSRTKESLNNILSNTSSILEISTQDAVKLKVNDGDRVQLSTDVHQEIIKVKIAQALPEGYLRLPNSKNLNQFTGNMGQTNPWYKFVYADIKVVESY
jgi:anaerobic selenocysteine-containing dehydrogenase